MEMRKVLKAGKNNESLPLEGLLCRMVLNCTLSKCSSKECTIRFMMRQIWPGINVICFASVETFPHLVKAADFILVLPSIELTGKFSCILKQVFK